MSSVYVHIVPNGKLYIGITVHDNSGKQMSEETKQKLSSIFKGKKMGPMSEEHKQKIRDAWKRKKEALT